VTSTARGATKRGGESNRESGEILSGRALYYTTRTLTGPREGEKRNFCSPRLPSADSARPQAVRPLDLNTFWHSFAPRCALCALCRRGANARLSSLLANGSDNPLDVLLERPTGQVSCASRKMNHTDSDREPQGLGSAAMGVGAGRSGACQRADLCGALAADSSQHVNTRLASCECSSSPIIFHSVHVSRSWLHRPVLRHILLDCLRRPTMLRESAIAPVAFSQERRERRPHCKRLVREEPGSSAAPARKPCCGSLAGHEAVRAA